MFFSINFLSSLEIVSTNTGVAINNEEYVPTIIPISIAR
jgi:hypothetical protein